MLSVFKENSNTLFAVFYLWLFGLHVYAFYPALISLYERGFIHDLV